MRNGQDGLLRSRESDQQLFHLVAVLSPEGLSRSSWIRRAGACGHARFAVKMLCTKRTVTHRDGNNSSLDTRGWGP